MASTFIKMTPLLFLSFLTTFAFECPPPNEIEPCKCFLIEDTRAFLICEGPLVSQGSIKNLFELVRSLNGPGILSIDEFRLTDTELDSLDVAPFSKCSFSSFDMRKNENLEKLTIGPPSSNGTDDYFDEEGEYIPFWADLLNFEGCSLTDQSLSNFNLIVNPVSVRYLILSSNKIEGPVSAHDGGDGEGVGEEKEFFYGLSTFTQLTQLILRFNLIGSLGAGQFRNNTRLSILDLQNNLIGQVGENAFLFNPASIDMAQVELMISLYGNKLNDSTFSPFSGLESVGRPIILDLEYNSFHSIGRQNFEKYLLDPQAQDRNQFWGTGNFWFCDNQMKWIKDAKIRLEARLTGIYCTNDPGQTVFTSSLID